MDEKEFENPIVEHEEHDVNKIVEEFKENIQQQMSEAEEQEYMEQMRLWQQEQTDEAFQEDVPHFFEQLIANGPTEQDIELWKRQFPKAKIFRVILMDDLFVYRTINRVEYKAIVAREELNPFTREELIAKLCLLYPVDIDSKMIGEGPAGTVSTLAKYIMKTSGFEEVQDIVRLA